MNSIYLPTPPFVNRELRHYCRFSTVVSKAYIIHTYLFNLLVLIMNLCMKELDMHLSNLNIPVPVKYAYFKLCMAHPLFIEFYIFKPGLSKEWGVTTKSIERYFSRFEEYTLFERSHESSKGIGKSGPALYGMLTPPLHLIYQNPPLTFSARFEEITPMTINDKVVKEVRVSKVYSEDGEIRLKNYWWTNFKEENLEFFEALYEGDRFEFKAIPESFKNKKGEGSWLLHKFETPKLI